MPRRAYFVFHQVGSFCPRLSLIVVFQCPEGLILYFTTGYIYEEGASSLIVSMPRRAYFVFHQEQDASPLHPDSDRFNAPKGLFCISPGLYAPIRSNSPQFQCPEGLILYFTCNIYRYYTIIF